MNFKAVKASQQRLVAVCVLVVTVGLATALPRPWQISDPHDPVTSATLMVAAGIVWALLGWWLLVLTATALTRSAGRLGRLGRRALVIVTPHAARGLLVTTVGVGAGLGLAGPALAGSATDLPQPAEAGETSGAAVVLDVDWPEPAIDWPDAATTADQLPAAPATPAPAPAAAGTEHVVLGGDTLWSIAARYLPADADADSISASWQQWYAANRDVIGPDPDLILPGQRLIAPASLPGGSS